MRIVLMGDLHYSARLTTRRPQVLSARDRAFEALIRRFFALPADWYVSIGDLVNDGRAEDFAVVYGMIRRCALRPSSVVIGPASAASESLAGWPRSAPRFVHVLGNHDVLLLRKSTVERITGMPRYWSVDTPEARLIFLDSTKERKWYDWGGTIDDDQLEWLGAELSEAREKPAFVFAHHPVYNTTVRSDRDRQSIHPSVPLDRVLAGKRGFNVFFSGHNHINSVVQKGNWLHVQTAAVLDILAYRVIDIAEGKVTLRFAPVGSPDVVRDVLRFIRYMRGFAPFRNAFGALDEAYLSLACTDGPPDPADEPVAWARA
ncbi:MAG: metallophosphoesterase [Hydrogenibacillus sp.]|nr:metallophosphoesterase [Hydrogenibacillus sp.]